jgi:hypothetical protein
MINYDNIYSLLSREPNIQQDVNFLINYINSLYKMTNRDKMNEFYNNIPTIFDKIFGISKSSTTQQQRNSLINLLNADYIRFEDLELLLHLFIPLQNTTKNLYTAITSPPDYVPDYKLSASVISNSISTLVMQNRQDLLISIGLFDDLMKGVDTQRQALDSGNIILTISEYYIMILLIAIRDYQGQSRLSLSRYNENFVDFPRYYENKKHLSEHSRDFMYSLEMNRSLVYNFYNLLMKTLVSTLSESKLWNDQMRLKFIISAIDLTWLTDYRIIKADSRFTVPMPNLVLIDCLKNVISILQRQIFDDDGYHLRDDALLFRLQRPMFYFLKVLINKFISESFHSEINLNDIIKVWYTYIMPWDDSSKTAKYKEYIQVNLLFYTELFNDYICAFSNLHKLSSSVLHLFNDILRLYIKNDKLIVNNSIDIDMLIELSIDKYYGKSAKQIDNHVKHIGSSKKNLYPFENEENRFYVKNLIENISKWKYTLNKEENPEAKQFIQSLDISKEIIMKLYNIKKDEISDRSHAQPSSSNYISFKRDSQIKGNVWKRKIISDESTILFYLFMNIAFVIDKIRKIPAHYDINGKREPPVTNLRPLCNYYNLISSFIFMTIIYILVKLIIAFL